MHSPVLGEITISHRCFQPGEKGGAHSVSPQNKDKPAQTGTILCRGRGGAHLPHFHCLLLHQSAASAHLHGGAGDRHPVGDARSEVEGIL